MSETQVEVLLMMAEEDIHTKDTTHVFIFEIWDKLLLKRIESSEPSLYDMTNKDTFDMIFLYWAEGVGKHTNMINEICWTFQVSMYRMSKEEKKAIDQRCLSAVLNIASRGQFDLLDIQLMVHTDYENEYWLLKTILTSSVF